MVLKDMPKDVLLNEDYAQITIAANVLLFVSWRLSNVERFQ